MHCIKHPNYKGLRYKKIRCSYCDKIFQEVARKTKEGGKYPSITTPDFKFGLIGFLAELSSVMVFGDKLKPLFWRRGSDEKHREFYSKNYTMLQSWFNRSPDKFKPIENLLYFLYTKHEKTIVAEKMNRPIVMIEKEKEETLPIVAIEIENKDKLNPWNLLLEKNNE